VVNSVNTFNALPVRWACSIAAYLSAGKEFNEGILLKEIRKDSISF